MTSKEPGQGERSHDPVAHQERTKQEASIKRNPHPDFKSVESSRPAWSENSSWQFTQTREPTWTWGQGGNDGGASLQMSHIQIDPYAERRPPVYNYKLLISGITPRPIGFISTISKDGMFYNAARLELGFLLMSAQGPQLTLRPFRTQMWSAMILRYSRLASRVASTGLKTL